MRTLALRGVDYAAVAEHDAAILRALGLVLSGGLILLWVALRLTPRQIGA